MKLTKGLLYLVIAGALWGAVVPIMKITLVEIPIFTLVFLRMGFASLILAPFVIRNLKLEKKDYKNVFLAAFLGTNINLAFFFFGLQNTTAINASILLATSPIFTLVFAHYMLKEKISFQLVAGTLLALFGIVSIVGIPILHLNTLSALGDLALIASSLAWVGHEIYSKKILKTYKPLAVSFYTMAIGAIIFAPLAVFELFKNPYWPTQVTRSGFFGLLYGIIFASFIAYSLWQIGLANTETSEASMVFYLIPLFGIVFSIILLHEKFSPSLIVGGGLVLLGIILAEYHRKTKPSHRAHHI